MTYCTVLYRTAPSVGTLYSTVCTEYVHTVHASCALHHVPPFRYFTSNAHTEHRTAPYRVVRCALYCVRDAHSPACLDPRPFVLRSANREPGHRCHARMAPLPHGFPSKPSSKAYYSRKAPIRTGSRPRRRVQTPGESVTPMTRAGSEALPLLGIQGRGRAVEGWDDAGLVI